MNLALKGFVVSQLTWRLLGPYWFKDGIVTTCALKFRWGLQRHNPQFRMDLVIRLASSRLHWPKVADLPGTLSVLLTTYVSASRCYKVFSCRMTLHLHIFQNDSQIKPCQLCYTLCDSNLIGWCAEWRVWHTQKFLSKAVSWFLKNYELIKMRFQCFFETSKSVISATRIFNINP
jgi:hypothetical protein